MSFVIKSPM